MGRMVPLCLRLAGWHAQGRERRAVGDGDVLPALAGRHGVQRAHPPCQARGTMLAPCAAPITPAPHAVSPFGSHQHPTAPPVHDHSTAIEPAPHCPPQPCPACSTTSRTPSETAVRATPPCAASPCVALTQGWRQGPRRTPRVVPHSRAGRGGGGRWGGWGNTRRGRGQRRRRCEGLCGKGLRPMHGFCCAKTWVRRMPLFGRPGLVSPCSPPCFSLVSSCSHSHPCRPRLSGRPWRGSCGVRAAQMCPHAPEGTCCGLPGTGRGRQTTAATAARGGVREWGRRGARAGDPAMSAGATPPAWRR